MPNLLSSKTETKMIRKATAFSFFFVVMILGLRVEVDCSEEVCPACVVNLNETFRQVALSNLDGSGPSSGICNQGIEYIHFGRDYGLTNNACCCLTLPPSDPFDCNVKHPPICPPIPTIGADELVSDYYARVGREVTNAPTNGCCPPGKYKWVFNQSYIGTTQNVCTCFTDNNFVTKKQICFGSSSESNE